MKYRMVRGLSSLDLNVIVQSPQACQSRMAIVLEAMYDGNIISDVVAEKAKIQFAILCEESTGPFQAFQDCKISIKCM